MRLRRSPKNTGNGPGKPCAQCYRHRPLIGVVCRPCLLELNPEQTPQRAPQTGPSGARKRRTRAAPDNGEPTRL
jgi:predicted amidophosphoribosyltransferase